MAEHYRVRDWEENGIQFPSGSYNITPDTFQPVVRLDHETGEREFASMKWGMVPYWSKLPNAPFDSINARSDKLQVSGAWIKPFQKRRCLIPAQFFYEWEPLTPAEKKKKISRPWAVALKDDRMFSFGGIWDRWHDKASDMVLESFAIVTTEPNELLNLFHDRTPLIIEPKDYDRWLAPAEPAHLPIDLVRTYPAEEMKAWRVAPLKGGSDGPQLLDPLPVTALEPPARMPLFG